MDFDLEEVQDEDCPRYKGQRLGGVRDMMGSEKGAWRKKCSVLSTYG